MPPPPLGITQFTPASLQADITALSTAASAFNTSRTARTNAHAALNAASNAAKKVLVGSWG